MGTLAQGLKWVGAIGRVEVRAGRDGILRIGLRAAGFAQRQRVMKEIVVPVWEGRDGTLGKGQALPALEWPRNFLDLSQHQPWLEQGQM